ncbi:MAG: hypothetical protein COA90_10060 [Gammaproteobacteria bacterium]|nr:MAG: hypothetical protein COA90_10060 [Gammaproteobacteria bacterium]
MEEALVRYVHFIGMIIISAALIGEHLLISTDMQLKLFKKLVFVNAIYALGAVLAIVGGVLLLVYVGKPAEFYMTNMFFHIKMTLFILAVMLSAFPTYYFLKQRKSSAETITIPKYIINIIRAEIMLLLILPLLGVFIASGIGHN